MPAKLQRYNPVFDSQVPHEPRAEQVLSADQLSDMRQVLLPAGLLQPCTARPPAAVTASAAEAMDVDADRSGEKRGRAFAQ